MDDSVKYKIINHESEADLPLEWARLSARMENEKRKRRIIPFFFMVGAVASLIAIVSYFPLSSTTFPEIESSELITESPISTINRDIPIAGQSNNTPPQKSQYNELNSSTTVAPDLNQNNIQTKNNIKSTSISVSNIQVKESVVASPSSKNDHSQLASPIEELNPISKIENKLKNSTESAENNEALLVETSKNTLKFIPQPLIGYLNYAPSINNFISYDFTPQLVSSSFEELKPMIVACCNVKKGLEELYVTTSLGGVLSKRTNYGYDNQMLTQKSLEVKSFLLGTNYKLSKNVSLDAGYAITKLNEKVTAQGIDLINSYRNNVVIATTGNNQNLQGLATDIKVNKTSIESYNTTNLHSMYLGVKIALPLKYIDLDVNPRVMIPVSGKYAYYTVDPNDQFIINNSNVISNNRYNLNIGLSKYIGSSFKLRVGLEADHVRLRYNFENKPTNFLDINSYQSINTKSILLAGNLRIGYLF